MKGGFSFGPHRRGSAEGRKPPPSLEADLGGVASPPHLKTSKDSKFQRNSRDNRSHI